MFRSILLYSQFITWHSKVVQKHQQAEQDSEYCHQYPLLKCDNFCEEDHEEIEFLQFLQEFLQQFLQQNPEEIEFLQDSVEEIAVFLLKKLIFFNRNTRHTTKCHRIVICCFRSPKMHFHAIIIHRLNRIQHLPIKGVQAKYSRLLIQSYIEESPYKMLFSYPFLFFKKVISFFNFTFPPFKTEILLFNLSEKLQYKKFCEKATEAIKYWYHNYSVKELYDI